MLHFLWSTAALHSSNPFNIIIIMYFRTCLKTLGSFLNFLTVEIGLVDELRLCFKDIICLKRMWYCITMIWKHDSSVVVLMFATQKTRITSVYEKYMT